SGAACHDGSGPGDDQPEDVRKIVPRVGQQRHGVRDKAIDGFDRDERQVEPDADRKGAAEIAAMMMVVTVVVVAAHGRALAAPLVETKPSPVESERRFTQNPSCDNISCALAVALWRPRVRNASPKSESCDDPIPTPVSRRARRAAADERVRRRSRFPRAAGAAGLELYSRAAAHDDGHAWRPGR